MKGDRLLLRARRTAKLQVVRLQRMPEFAVIAAGLLVVAIVLFTTREGAEWPKVLRSQAVNVVSGLVFGGFAYLLFVLRFRTAQLNAYLDRCHSKPSPGPDRPGLYAMSPAEREPFVSTMVDELLTARPRRSCLVIGPGEAGCELLADVTERLASPRAVPVLIDVAQEDDPARVPGLVKDEFVSRLVGTAGDERNGQRLYAALWKKRRIVAIVAGLNEVGQGKPVTARRATITEMLEELLREGIPFAAYVQPALAPSISEVAVFRVRPLSPASLLGYVVDRLARRNVPVAPDVAPALQRVFASTEPTRDPVLLDLGVDLLALRLAAGEKGPDAVGDLFDDACLARRHLRWMCEWTLRCSPSKAGEAHSPAAAALAAIGMEGHYREALEISLDDVSKALDVEGRRRLAVGVAVLTERGVLTVSTPGKDTLVRFTHLAWFAFAGALALKLDRNRWADLLRPGAPPATLEALTAALLLAPEDELRDERSFVAVLRRVGLEENVEISLDTALAVITALQSVDEPIVMGATELEAVERGWDSSNDEVRMRFVAEVDLERAPALIDFLWSQVVPPRFSPQTFRVRKAICRRLANTGSATLRRLGPTWTELIEKGRIGDLSSYGRREPHWRQYGSSLASLGWVLPGLVRAVGDSDDREAALALLATLRDVVAPDDERAPLPEVGLEISLAEGFKTAAVDVALRGQPCDDRWQAEARAVCERARSWISRQALLQAFLLVATDAGRAAEVAALAEDYARSSVEHPFIRETAALVSRALERRERLGNLLEHDLWFDDIEALDDGGVSLSSEAHRLLALSTLLINLSEHGYQRWITAEEHDAPATVVASRERAFTGSELPVCFERRGHAATMFEVACDCSFGLCGPAAKGPVGQRRFSRSFVQRAQVTARSPAIAPPAVPFFARKGFEQSWRLLDEELSAPATRPAKKPEPSRRRRRRRRTPATGSGR